MAALTAANDLSPAQLAISRACVRTAFGSGSRSERTDVRTWLSCFGVLPFSSSQPDPGSIPFRGSESNMILEATSAREVWDAAGVTEDELAEAHARLSQAILLAMGDSAQTRRSSASGPGSGSGIDWFLLWISAVMARRPMATTLELVSALTR